MADISSVTLPNGSSYDIKDKIARASIKFGKVNSTSTSTAFTATVEGITELYDGVAVYLTNGVVTSASGCTLDVNGLGAKPMYYTTAAASRVTTHFNIAYTWLFVYNSTRVSGGCWDAYWGYDSNSDAVGYNLRDGSNGYKVKNVLYRYQILFTYDNEYLLPSNTVQTSQTGPYSYTTEEFDPFGKIYTYTTTTQVAANGIPSSSYLYYAYATVDARWSFNVGTTLTSQKAVYIVAIPRKNGKAVLADPPVTQTLPTEEDGLLYIFLGQAYSTYQIAMSAEKPVYMFQDGAMKRITGIALESTSKRTLSGSIVHFEDGLDDFPIDDLVVDINPVQDLNGYDSPWPGGGGANQWDEEWEPGIYDSTTGLPAASTANIRSKNSISVSPQTTFYIYVGTAGASIKVCEYDANDTFLRYQVKNTNTTVTTTSDTAYLRFSTVNYGNAYAHNIAINYPSTVTTYSPYSNICPITGWASANVTRTGKNLLNPNFDDYSQTNAYSYILGVVPQNALARFTFTDKDTTIDVSGCYIGFVWETPVSNVPVSEFRWAVLNGSIQANTSNRGGNNVLCGNVFIYPKTKEVFDRLFARWNIMVELGSTATAYESYQGTTIPISFGSAGTVYGGTLDVTTGELTVDRAMVDLGTLTWGRTTSYANPVFYAELESKKNPNQFLCSIFEFTGNFTGVTAFLNAGGNSTLGNCSANRQIYVREDSCGSIPAFVDLVRNQHIVYELATSQTYQLTPTEVTTLLGVNNIWADTGDSTVTYYNANLDGVVADTIKEFRDYRSTSDEDLDSLHDSIDNVANTVQEHYTALTSLNDYVRGQVYTLTTDSSVNPGVTYYQYLYSAEKDEYYYEVYQTQPWDNPASLGLYVLSDDPDSLKSRVEGNTASIVANRYDINIMDNEISNLTGLSSEILTGIGSIRLGYTQIVGTNLFNVDDSNNIQGSYLNDSGIVVLDGLSIISDYIPCKPSTTYTVQSIPIAGSQSNTRMFTYDENKQLISLIAKKSASPINVVTSVSGATEANAKYIRISGYFGEINGSYKGYNAMLQEGSVATEYEPYIPDVTYYGVCVGNNIGFDSSQSRSYPPGSKAIYYLIDPKQTFTLITTDQVQFWVGGNLIGWFDKSDNVFHSTKQKVEQAMEVKDWQMVNSGGFGLRYIGV